MYKTGLLAAGLALAALPAVSEERRYDFRGFDSIAAESAVEVVVRKGATYQVNAHSEAGDLRGLKLRQKGDTLYVSRKSRRITWGLIDLLRREEARYVVTVIMPEVENVKARASAVVDVRGHDGEDLDLIAAQGAEIRVAGVAYDEIEAKVSSGGSMTLSGQCVEFEGKSSSGAQLDAEALVCANVSADSSSGSDLRMHGTRTARIEASSGASVQLAGSAKVLEADQSSGGVIRY